MGNCFDTEEDRPPMKRAEERGDSLDLTQHENCEANYALQTAPHMQSDYAPPEAEEKRQFRNM